MAEGGGAEQRYGVEEEGPTWSWWSSAAAAQACRHRERGVGEDRPARKTESRGMAMRELLSGA